MVHFSFLLQSELNKQTNLIEATKKTLFRCGVSCLYKQNQNQVMFISTESEFWIRTLSISYCTMFELEKYRIILVEFEPTCVNFSLYKFIQ